MTRLIYIWGIVIITLLAGGETASLHARRAAPEVSVLTYNIYGYKKISDRRVDALVSILRYSKADIIALQEVNSWFVNRLRREKWVKKFYHTVEVPRGRAPEGKLFTLSRFPIAGTTYHQLPTKSNHGALITYVKLGKRLIPVVNIHLESPLHEKDLRAEQLKTVFGQLKDQGGVNGAIVLGDFNFGDNAFTELDCMDSSFVDLWIYCNPESLRYTWDMHNNPLAIRNAYPGESSRRLDRILVHGNSWKVLSAGLIGDFPLSYGRRVIFPSDHYGVMGTITLR